jgi:mutator protein MutT
MSEAFRRRIAVAIIEQDEKFLITQRKSDAPFANLWELPGGKCEDGEEAADCVMREVREETGLVVLPEIRACVIEHAYVEQTVEMHVFFCRIKEGSPRCIASQALAWIGWDEIEHYSFPAANQILFAQASIFRKRRESENRS